MRLTDVACKGFKSAARPYKKSDGGGLYLYIKPNNAKLWQMKYNYLGKSKTLSFGAYPAVSLAEARAEREQAKKLLRQGIDPMAAKKGEKRQAIRNAQSTFKITALEWHEKEKGDWSVSHAQRQLNILEKDIFPMIGDMPIADITAPDLVEALRKIEKRGAFDMVSRARQICGQVFRYGVQLGRCHHNPAPDLQGAFKTRKEQHFAAIEGHEIADLVDAVHRNDARLYQQTRNAIILSLLFFVRPGELRQARWDEIDFEKCEWRIPAERMKMRKAHIVPLSRQAIELLKRQREDMAHLKSAWVFPSQKGAREPMSNGTVLGALKRLGFNGRMTAHGFRALARSTIREELDYPADVIEVQLAHKPSGPLGAAYDRAQFLTQRRKMMQDWADHIDRVTHASTTILPFKKHA